MTVRVGIVGSGFMGRTWAEVAANHADRHVAQRRRPVARAARPWRPTSASRSSRTWTRSWPATTSTRSSSPRRRPATSAQTLAAAAAGKHLLVEKPMAQSATECAEMVAACRAAGVRLSVVSQHRFRDAPVAAKQLIDDGAIGEIRMIQVTGAEVGWWDLKARGDEWKLDPRQQTAWASWGAHSCDLLRWFSGADGELAFARITNFSGEPPGVGQSAAVTFEMTSGVLVQILMSYEFPPPGIHPSWPWRIVGSTGIIELDPYASVRLGRGDGWSLVAEQAPFDPLDASDPVRLRAYARQLEDLVDAIVEGHDPLVSGEEGRRTTAMLDAAERSAASGTSAAVA